MTSNLATRIVASLGLAAILSVGAIIGSLGYMAHRQDELASQSEQALIKGGIAALDQKLNLITSDYAWWEEGYNKIIANDTQWLTDNYGVGVFENGTFDILVILDKENRPLQAWDTETGRVSDPSLFNGQALTDVTKDLAKLTDSKSRARAIYTHVRGKPAVLSFAKAVALNKADKMVPGELPTLVIGYYLTPERIAEIGKGFLIEGLALKEAKEVPADAITLSNSNGTTLGYLEWTHSQPGAIVLRQATLPLGFYLAAFLGVMFFVGTRARFVAKKLAASENEAQTAAKTDRLTGLPNRHGFLEHCGARSQAVAAEHGTAGIIFVDLNGFKEVNDTAGHSVGDELLRIVSGRFRRLLPASTFLARIGGDEFAAILTSATAVEDTSTFAELIVRALDQPVGIGAVEYHVGAAVGYALSSPHHIRSFDEMLHDADTAMYHAKSKRESHAMRFHAGLEAEAQTRRAIEVELRIAIKEGELFVEYQPVVNAADGVIVSAEALVRWRSPSRGMVSPAQFIAVAETCGLIQTIGVFVLRRVCEDIKRIPGITVSVNVSPVQIKDPVFVDEFIKIVQSHGVEPSRIEIELTENVLVDNPAAASKRLAALKAAGFRINLDDFGIGFSSLGYLQTLPFDKLKVDRKFISGIGKSDSDNKLLQSLALMCESLKLEIVAEGVEHEEQARLLKLLRFDQLQGWHTGRPMPLEALCQRLHEAPKQQLIA